MVLPKRTAKFGLTVHPDKTRLVDFRHPWQIPKDGRPDGGQGGKGGNDTFDLLGFTFYWGKTRRNGWAVLRKTMSSRLTRAVKSVWQWCKKHRHKPVCWQWEKLCQKLRGHYGFYGCHANGQSLSNFRIQVTRSWQYWLNHRHRKRKMRWERMNRLRERYPLPNPKIAPRYA